MKAEEHGPIPKPASVSIPTQRRGYRDGFHGFAVCLLHAWYPVLEQLKRWEKRWKWEHAAASR